MHRILNSLVLRRATRATLGVAASLCLSALGVGLSQTVAQAGGNGHGIIYVSHTGTPNASGNSCATAQYSTVQGAVTAASNGAQIYLCGTVPYAESVAIQNKNLTLTGDDGATIEAPSTLAASLAPTTFFSNQGLDTPYSVVTVIGSSNVSISGLRIEGPFPNAGCGGDDFGILQVGGTLQLMNDSVLNVGAADQADYGGCQYGVAIQVGREYWPCPATNLSCPSPPNNYLVTDFVGDAQIHGVTVAGYQKNGITVDGPASEAQIDATTVLGGGPNPNIARNGIQISRGATGAVQNSTISGNEYTGPFGAYSTGVVVFGGCGDPLDIGVQIHNNTLVNDDNAISVGNYDPTCSTTASTPTDVQVHNNTITKNDGDTNVAVGIFDESGNEYNGYQAAISDTGDGDQIHNNTITGTIVDGVDTAYGPQTSPGGPFLVPIDIQTFPPINASVHNNTYDGNSTNPPY